MRLRRMFRGIGRRSLDMRGLFGERRSDDEDRAGVTYFIASPWRLYFSMALNRLLRSAMKAHDRTVNEGRHLSGNASSMIGLCQQGKSSPDALRRSADVILFDSPPVYLCGDGLAKNWPTSGWNLSPISSILECFNFGLGPRCHFSYLSVPSISEL